jgi:F-type H+-transporting ATPase subunit epsilon
MAIGPHASSELDVLAPHSEHGQVGQRLVVNVVTPKGSLVTQDVAEIIVPGSEGELGVLPGHIPFLTALKAGVLTIRHGTERQIYAAGPGFLQVGAGTATILIEMAEPAAEVDVDKARADRSEAEEQLKAPTETGPGAAGLAKDNLDWAQARLDAAAAREK